MKFGGFDRSAIELLATLPDYDEEQFAEVKEVLGTGLREPGLALIHGASGELDAELTVSPRSSVSPLHRDLRFAQAPAPRYKDHLLLTAWEGADKKTSPTLWIRISAKSAGFASGIAFTPEVRSRFRKAVAGAAGDALARDLARLEKRHARHGFQVAGDQLKKVPKPWAEDHPRADLLRRNGFQVRFAQELPRSVDKPSFQDWCRTRLDELLVIHRWLVKELS
jgi:uncharacterized protein (DUF2461 family)